MKIGAKTVLFAAAAAAFLQTAYGNGIPVRINGREISYAVIKEERALAPFRAVFESLGYDVEWDNGKISASDGERMIELNVGSDIALVYDGAEDTSVDCGGAVEIIDDRAYVPVRAAAEISGCDVEWDGQAVDIFPYEEASGGELKYPVFYSFDEGDPKYILEFIRRNTDHDPDRFKVSVNSLTEMDRHTVVGVVSLNYMINGFESDCGYDFYVFNGLAKRIEARGDCGELENIEPPEKSYTDGELLAMAAENITIGENEIITGQRVNRKYRNGKYIYSVVTEIEGMSSGISRAEYFSTETSPLNI